MKKDIFYTYIYLDPRKPDNYVYGDYTFEYEPFYVGKGKNGQLLTHLKEARSNIFLEKCTNSYKIAKIRNILKENLKPIILKIEEYISEQEAFNLESWLIWGIEKYPVGPLTNLTDGGDGASGWHHNKETKYKISKANKGKIASPETKYKISKANKGKPAWNKEKITPLETKEKQSESARRRCVHGMKGKTHSLETREKLSQFNKGKSSPNKGKKSSPKTIQKLRDSWKKRKNYTNGEIL